MVKETAFTIVIPLYNKVLSIKRALCSVFSQSYADFEIIVIDDGSTDKGVEIVKDISDKRIRLIQQMNQGVSTARNNGIKNAQSDLIAFLDADDEWMPNHLEVLEKLVKKFPDSGAFITSYQKRLENGKLLKPDFKAIPAAPWEGIVPDYFKTVATGPTLITSSTVAIWKNIFEKTGYFREDIHNGEDVDMWLRIALEYTLAFSRKTTVTYYVGDAGSATGRLKTLTDFKSHYFNEWPKMRTKEYSYFNEYIAKKQLILLTELYLSGYQGLVRSMLKNVKTNLFRISKMRLYLKTFINSQTLIRLSSIKKKLFKKPESYDINDRFV